MEKLESLRIVMIYELGPKDDGSFLGGIESHILGLAKELAHDHQVTILTGAIPGERDKTDLDGLNVIRSDIMGMVSRSWNPTNLTTRRQIFSTPAFLRTGIDLDADIYHGHIYTSGISALGLASLGSGGSVNTIHGSYYDHWESITNSSLKPHAYRVAERLLATFLARNCDRQIHTATDFAVKVRQWGAPQEKVQVILNGVDTDRFSPQVNPREQSDIPIVMTVRRLVPKNGVHHFIQACSHLERESRFVIVGDGPSRPGLESLARRIGVDDRVEFRGAIPNNQMPGIIAGADVLVIPSLVEASSISLLEAMAMAKPTVVTNIPGIDEVASPERSIMVPPGNPEAIATGIDHLLSDRKKARELGRKGREYVVANRSIKKMTEKTMIIYRQALES